MKSRETAKTKKKQVFYQVGQQTGPGWMEWICSNAATSANDSFSVVCAAHYRYCIMKYLLAVNRRCKPIVLWMKSKILSSIAAPHTLRLRLGKSWKWNLDRLMNETKWKWRKRCERKKHTYNNNNKLKTKQPPSRRRSETEDRELIVHWKWLRLNDVIQYASRRAIHQPAI